MTAAKLATKKNFGEQFGLFFTAPLQRDSLWRLIPVTLVLLLAQIFSLKGVPGLSIAMFWLALVAQFVVLWYGFQLLARFAAGVFDSAAPWPDDGIDNDVMLRAAFVWVVLWLISLSASSFSKRFGLGVELLLAFVKPAIVMLIALRSPVMDALNPNRWWEIISTLGSRYFTLFVLLWALFSLRSWASSAELKWLPLIAAADFFSLYALLVSCCMMGYCLYEKAFELDHTTQEDWQAQFAHQRAENVHSKSADDWLKEGKPQQALARAYELARTKPHEVNDQLRYYNLLRKLDRKPEQIEAQAERLMTAYALAHQPQEAAALLKLEQNSRLTVLHESPADLYAVAQALRRTHDPEHIKTALSLVANYTEARIGEMSLPKFLLVQAKCHHALGEKPEAKELLQRIATRYPAEMPEVQEAKAALQGKKQAVAQ
jgi:hypothetical protein